MNFTDKFIKLPCEIFNNDFEDEKLNNPDGLMTFIKVDPFTIGRYHPVNYSDDYVLDGTKILFKDGTDIMIPITIDEFEKILNDKTLSYGT